MQLTRVTKHIGRDARTPKWHVIDAKGQRLGRLASRVATILQGKHSASFSRHDLTGDFVVVVNAGAIEVTGNKPKQKLYWRHSGYVGGIKSETLDTLMEKHPERVIEKAVKSMLPGNRLGDQMFSRLKVYNTPDHPHAAQVNAGQGKPKTEAKGEAKPRRSRAKAPAAPRATEGAGTHSSDASGKKQEGE